MKIQRHPLALLAMLACASAIGAQTTWVVDDDACPGPGTGTVLDPFCKVQDGIAAAVDGDTVLVLPGTYLENLDFLGKAIAVTSDQGPGVTVLDGSASADPDYGSVVIFQSGEGPLARLEGFTITGGTGSIFLGTTWRGGGGLMIRHASSPTIANNVITGNSAGSLLADSWGGGIDVDYDSSPLIVGNIVSNNTAYGAAGISLYLNCAPTIEGNVIRQNHAYYGAGILGEELCAPIIRDNVIEDNVADGWSGGLRFWNQCAPIVEGNVITGNEAKAGSGGGVSIVVGSSGSITNNVIAANSATAAGGGIWVYDAAPEIRGNAIHSNSAFYGGGIDLATGASVTIAGNTLYGNTALFGDGLSCRSGSDASVVDTIFWANAAGAGFELYVTGGGTALTIDHSDVEGGPSATYVWVGTLSWGAGMLDADPLFVDASKDDLRILAGSPCIDAGDPASLAEGRDLAGNPRLLDGDLDLARVVDMGAHEFDHVQLAVSGAATPGGTLTLDTSGTSGMLVLLFVGTAPGEVCHPLYGCLFLDPLSYWFVKDWGAIPSSVPVPLAPSLATPLPLVLQEVAFDLLTLAGNTSNPVAITIE